MRKFLFPVLLISACTLFAQPNTNVYLFDIVQHYPGVSFENMRIVSNQNGYDNQPSFYDNETIIFVSTRNEQTDIAKYDIASGTASWLTNTPLGSEYSPLRIPNSEDISAIRLDKNGLQRLYRYGNESWQPTLLIDKLKVGYHVWDTEDQLITSVLVKDGMNLMLNYLPENKNNTIDQGVGRSLHKIPSSKSISFISSANGSGMIASYNTQTGKIKDLFNMPSNAQDMCWLNKTEILIPNGKQIMLATLGEENALNVLHEFKEKEIYNISRMAVSPDGRHLVLVTDDNPEMIIDKQVETFNSKDLNGFASCFSDSVEVRNFPNIGLYAGRSKIKANYGQHMAENFDTQVEVVQRIVMGDVIIDEEIVKENGETYHQAAIYEVENGQIKSMTFIHENTPPLETENIVKRQLEAYNARNIDLFVDTYTEDVTLADFPETITLTGKPALRDSYTDFFKRAKDLNCTINNRIVVGNKVIDEEVVSIGNAKFKAVAIYEIDNNLIKKVTFIR